MIDCIVITWHPHSLLYQSLLFQRTLQHLIRIIERSSTLLYGFVLA